jgi:hypothetical protein
MGLMYADTQWKLPNDHRYYQKKNGMIETIPGANTCLGSTICIMITTVQSQAYLVRAIAKYIDRNAQGNGTLSR